MISAESKARARFVELIARPEIPLAEASLALAEEEYPDIDAPRYVATLDGLAELVRRKLSPFNRGPAALLKAIRAVLFEDGGFRGNADDYYDPRNSYLNEVLDRRLGIPISLSVVYIEVARRSGLDVQGVAFPGHFLVKHASARGDLLIDPFHGGEVLSAEDAEKRLSEMSGGRVRFDPKFLDGAGTREILARMLHNLKRIYVEKEDDVRTLWVIDRLLLLAPDNIEERRDRGLVSARLGGHAAAVKDLIAYLEAQPEAEDASDVEALIAELKSKGSYLN
jgi:regulator of sirC expression with transglutaminase-like and TPR domain